MTSPTTVEGYRKKTRKEVVLPDGSVFIIKSPDVGILLKHLDVLTKLKDHKGGLDAAHVSGIMTFLADMLPSTVVEPAITLEGSDTSLAVGEIKFLDRMTLVMNGISMAGLSEGDLKEVKDFQKQHQGQS